MKKIIYVLLVMCFASGLSAQPAGVDQGAEKKIRGSLAVMLPGLEPDTIRATPIEGLYEVTFGLQLVYVTGDGKFLLQGSIVDLETRHEITENRRSELKKAAMAEVKADQTITYEPEDSSYTVTVFTDIDCGFCRKLHAQMDAYNRAGIGIRYVFYPRAGVGSDSYNKAVSVWCADDRKSAMDAAKAGRSVAAKTCPNPVAEHHALGQAMQIRGTPALVLESGETLPGYVPPDKLRQVLDERAAQGG